MLSLRNLFRRKTRTTLTITGVAVGVSIVVALMAVSRGFRTQINGMFSADAAHLVLSQKDATDPILSYLPEDSLPTIAAVPGVAEVHPVVISAVQKPPLVAFIVYGTTPGSPFLTQMTMIDGRTLFDGPAENAICVGRSAAEVLEIGVGDTIELAGADFEVVGVYESATPLVDAGAVMSFQPGQKAMGLQSRMTTALVQIDPFTPEHLAEVELAIEAAVPEATATKPSEWTNVFDEFELADQMVAVFSVLAIAIGGISVMNTMLMSVFERTREIGVLQAVGWSPAMVLRQVLLEALLISVVGSPLGILLGMGVVEGVGSIDSFRWIAGDYGTSVFVTAFFVGIGMGVVGAAYPAWRAVRITPIEALRYE